MNHRQNHFPLTSALSLGLLLAAAVNPAVADLVSASKPAHPNVVVILADDLGWNDISLHGSGTPTPNIDRLAAQGIEFRNLIVNSVCSPSRAAFYTGREAIRSGYGGEVGDRINPNFRTIAHSFQSAGYRTGLFGKWHNGKPADDKRGESPWCPTPMKEGFETFVGFYGGGTDFFNQTPTAKKIRNWYINEKQTEEGQGYLTDLITENAVRFIEEQRNKPFFCMVAEAAPHEPFQATDALLKRVPAKIRGDIQLSEEMVRERSRDFQRTRKTDPVTWEYGGFTEAERRVVYSAMVIGLDDSVGRIVDTLKKTGQDKNTAILFFSDNGAMHFIREGNLPYRGWKHDMYDGAIHSPGMLCYPQGGLVGGTKHQPLIRAVDLYPTLASLAGIPIEDAKTLDGVDHLAVFQGKTPAPELDWNGIFVRYGGYRDNQWKLIARAGSSELYDVIKDPSESENVAEKYPEIASKLRARHDAWLKQHGANVNYTAPAVTAAPAQPQGDVLEVTYSAPAKREKQQLDIVMNRGVLQRENKLSTEDFVCTPGDCLVYDMKLESMVPGQTAYISTLRDGSTLFEENGPGVNVDGTPVASTLKLPAPLNQWKRYILGIGNSAAFDISPLRLVVNSTVAGDIRVLFDNIQIVKPDGRVIPVWAGGKAPDSSKSGLKLSTRSEAATPATKSL